MWKSVLAGDKGDREEKCSWLPLGFQPGSLGIHATPNEKQNVDIKGNILYRRELDIKGKYMMSHAKLYWFS